MRYTLLQASKGLGQALLGCKARLLRLSYQTITLLASSQSKHRNGESIG